MEFSSERVAAAAIVVTFLTLVGTGCGSQTTRTSHDGSKQPEPKITATQRITSDAQLSLPMDSYHLSPEQEQQFQQARNVFLHNCMARYGFDLSVPISPIAHYPKNALQLGWLDDTLPDRYGYHGPPGQAEKVAKASQGQQAPIAVPNRMLPAFDGSVKEYNGLTVPQGGCNGEFARRINVDDSKGAVDNTNGRPPELEIESLEEHVAGDQVRADSRFAALTSAWRKCMQQSGFNYPSPDDAAAKFWGNEKDAATLTVSAQEIKVATTDQACRKKINYSGMIRGLTVAYQNRLINDKGELLRQLHNLLLLRLKNSVLINSAPSSSPSGGH